MDVLHRMKGGPEFNLLLRKDAGVYFVVASITPKYSKEKKSTMHAFIYDSFHKSEKHPDCHGAFICNRHDVPMRLLEKSDRLDKESARDCLSSFFANETVRLTYIYKLVPKNSS